MIDKIIKENMEVMNLSGKDVTLLLGISSKYLSEILNGHKTPSYETSILFDKLFGFEKGEIFSYTKKYEEIANLNKDKKIARIYENTFKHLNTFKVMSKISIYKKIINFFPTNDLDLYKKYLYNKSIDFFKYKDEPSAYLWTSMMEKKYCTEKASGVFNKSRADQTLDKAMDILFMDKSFDTRIKLLEDFLDVRGIVLGNSPFLPGSNVNGVVLKKGTQNYIFMNDKQKREYQYIFAFAHEFMHLYIDHKEDNKIVANRIKKYMSKTGNTHAELNMAFKTFESKDKNKGKWNSLRENTHKKIEFGNIEEFISSI